VGRQSAYVANGGMCSLAVRAARVMNPPS